MKAKVKQQLDDYYIIFETEGGFGWFELGGYVAFDEDDVIIGDFEKYDIQKIIHEKSGKVIEIIYVEEFEEEYEYVLEEVKKDIARGQS